MFQIEHENAAEQHWSNRHARQLVSQRSSSTSGYLAQLASHQHAFVASVVQDDTGPSTSQAFFFMSRTVEFLWSRVVPVVTTAWMAAAGPMSANSPTASLQIAAQRGSISVQIITEVAK